MSKIVLYTFNKNRKSVIILADNLVDVLGCIHDATDTIWTASQVTCPILLEISVNVHNVFFCYAEILYSYHDAFFFSLFQRILVGLSFPMGFSGVIEWMIE